MARPRKYASNAERQAAYRARKSADEKVGKFCDECGELLTNRNSKVGIREGQIQDFCRDCIAAHPEWRITLDKISAAPAKSVTKPIVTPKPAPAVKPIGVALAGVYISTKTGCASVEVELKRTERKETYNAKFNGGKRFWIDHSETKRKADGTIDWIHEVNDVRGALTINYEQWGATTEQLVAGLTEKYEAVLRQMNLWDDCFPEQFAEQLADTLEWYADAKERRSQSAREAAATRKRNAKPVTKPAPAPVEKPKVEPAPPAVMKLDPCLFDEHGNYIPPDKKEATNA